MKITRIKVPIYTREVRVVYSTDMDAVTKKFDLRAGAEKYDAFCFRKGDYIYAVFQSAEPHIIAHECVHLVNMIFDDVHVEPDLLNDEPQAYLVGWLFGKIYKILPKKF
jgi:hypothetical protein